MKTQIIEFGLSDKVASLLDAKGFHLEQCCGPDQKAFGNMQLVLSSPSLRLRLARDRDDEFVDICPLYHQEKWSSFFGLVRETNHEIYDEANLRFRVPTNEIFTAALTTGWQRLEQLLSPEHLADTRSRLAAKRRAEFPLLLRKNRFSESAIQQILRTQPNE